MASGNRYTVPATVLLVIASLWRSSWQPGRAHGARAAQRSMHLASTRAVSLAPIAASPSAQHVAARAQAQGDDATFGGDVTIPDGTVLAPGEHFIKTWRIHNSGTTTWQAGYTWHFEAGSQLADTLSIPAPITPPGQDALLSVAMTAPTTAGTYTSFWQMTNSSGALFGHQAYVTITVRSSGGQTPTATQGTNATPVATATPTAMPVTAVPTVPLPGGNGQLVASPWIGALTYRTFLAAGSTATGLQEHLYVVYPGPGSAHVRLTLFRPDAAQRQVLFTLGARQERSFDLARIAPGTALAAIVDADRYVVVDRTIVAPASVLGAPAAARTARQWYFPAIAPQAQPDQRLIFFNPHDVPVRVALLVGHSGTSCCERTLQVTVPPMEQFSDDLGADTTLRGPLSVTANDAVAVERLTFDATQRTMNETGGTVQAARTWYFPGTRSGPSGTVLRLFNPGGRDVQATLRVALPQGAGASRQVSVPRLSEADVAVGTLAPAPTFGIEVDGTGPIVAEASALAANGQPDSVAGSVASARGWLLVGSDGGKGTSQTIQILNPNAAQVSVTCAITVNGNRTRSWTATLPPHSAYSRVLDGLLPTQGASLQVSATAPVVVGRLLSSVAGEATTLARTSEPA